MLETDKYYEIFDLTMLLGKRHTKQSSIKNSILINFCNQHLQDIQSPSSRMDKLAAARPIPWLEFRKNSIKKYSNRIKLMESYREPSKIYGIQSSI